MKRLDDLHFVICRRDDLVSMMTDAIKYWALKNSGSIDEPEHEEIYGNYMHYLIELLDKDEFEYFDGHKATKTEIINNEKPTFRKTAELLISNSPAYDCINVDVVPEIKTECHGCDPGPQGPSGLAFE